MKFLVALSCILAVAIAKPSHIQHDVLLPQIGLEKYGYGYSTFGHMPLISSPMITYNAIPAYKTIGYKTEVASSVVGHDTTVSHQDSTVHHGGAVVQEVAPAVEVKTFKEVPVFHDVPKIFSYAAPALSHSVITHKTVPYLAYKTEITAPVVSHETISHDTTVAHEIAPAVEVKSLPAVHDTVVTHAAPVVTSETIAPITKISSLESTVLHPNAYIQHSVPVAGYTAGFAAPIFAHGTHNFFSHPTAYSVAHTALDKTQYHAQDFIGQATYGHSEAFQQHHAAQDAAGNKFGSFSWVAPNGQIIGEQYVADALGYRVASNALPVGPLPVADTPEVIAARSAHFAAHAKALGHLH